MIQSLDHLVLTVADLAAAVAFYEGLGMTFQTFGEGRHALHFGKQKINLHIKGREFEPKASFAAPGTADLCFLVNVPAVTVAERLRARGIPIVLGPVEKIGAQGRMNSVYCRDPDGNLIELSELIVS
jgi:catechol 2,3-dioxygenase-like lactoylglutathione lyase family enzyme